ncbi:M28 family peptidase [Halovivax gelatinilyticus]|uniref:M28 family peptidase n=1 Tax=Halovivax gelatinilyticus TaxID=2961597 RepID=UPI0020CA9BCC|nr:M28 family peptidase [Halovivax gelatinilyticus]
MTEWIAETYTSDVGWSLLEELVDVGNRMAGSDGEREGAELTRDALAEVGARTVRLEEYDIQGWTRGTSRLAAGGAEQDCIALPRSPAGEVTAELVDVGYGLPEDFADADLDGAVAMARSDVPDHFDRYIHRREKYYHAVEAGAAAFVYRNHVEGCLPPTGSVGTPEDPIGDIPAIGVSSEVGARLARRFDGDSVTVAVEADVHPATSQNVHAELGPETDERVLVTSHVDAHDIAEGAMDNAAGTAMVVEIANALASREDELETRVEFVAFGSEEIGLVGSAVDADRRDHDGVKAILNNDGVTRGRTLRAFPNGFDELASLAETVGDRYDHPLSIAPEPQPHSDHWPYVQWGVPGYMMMSETGESGRGWGHTFADTFDKLDRRNHREQSIVLADLAVELAREDFEVAHRDPESIAADLEEANLAEGMKIIGDWPYDF